MVDVELIVAPHDSGPEDRRMGAGPRALLRAGAVTDLESFGARVAVRECHPEVGWRAELRWWERGTSIPGSWHG